MFSLQKNSFVENQSGANEEDSLSIPSNTRLVSGLIFSFSQVLLLGIVIASFVLLTEENGCYFPAGGLVSVCENSFLQMIANLSTYSILLLPIVGISVPLAIVVSINTIRRLSKTKAKGSFYTIVQLLHFIFALVLGIPVLFLLVRIL